MAIIHTIRSASDLTAIEAAVAATVREDAEAFYAHQAGFGGRQVFTDPDYNFADARKWATLGLAARGEYRTLCEERLNEALETRPNDSHRGALLVKLG